MRFLKLPVDPWALIYCVGIWAGVGTVAGLFGLWHWFLDLAAQFRPQYLLLLAPLALLELFRRRFRNAAAFGTLALINAAFVAPAYLPADSPGVPSGRLRVLFANVHILNARYDAVLSLARDADPDVILLQEVDAVWADALRSLTNTHPHSFLIPRDDCYGLGLYSRRPLVRAASVRVGEGWVPALSAELDVSGRRVHLLCIHALPPSSREAARIRNDLLGALPGYLDRLSGEKIVIGDFNVTPGSWHFHRLLKHADLRSSREGRGIQPTWPAPLPRIFRLPIDDALLSPGLQVLDWRIGPFVGSDHYPVIIDAAVAK